MEAEARKQRRILVVEPGCSQLTTSSRRMLYIYEHSAEPVTPYTLCSEGSLEKGVELATFKDMYVLRMPDPLHPQRPSWVHNVSTSKLRRDLQLLTESIVAKMVIMKNLDHALSEEEGLIWNELEKKSKRVLTRPPLPGITFHSGALIDEVLRNTAGCVKDPRFCTRLEGCTCCLVRQVLGRPVTYGRRAEETCGSPTPPTCAGLTATEDRKTRSSTISAGEAPAPTSHSSSDCSTSTPLMSQSRGDSCDGFQILSGSLPTSDQSPGFPTMTLEPCSEDYTAWHAFLASPPHSPKQEKR